MGLREEVLSMKEEVKDMKEMGMARELLKDYKKQNKRQFIIILVLIALWFITMCYIIVLLNKTNENASKEIAYTQIQHSNIKDSEIYIGV